MAQEQILGESQLKFGETSANFRSNSSSILAVSEQWRHLQESLITVRNSLGNRVRGFDSEERESGGFVGGDRCYRSSEIKLRQKFVELGEKLGEKRFNQEDESERCERKDLIELYRELYATLESKEKRIIEECGRLMLKEEEIREKCEELERRGKEIDERGVVLEAKEMELDKRCARIGAIESDLELGEKRLVERGRMLRVKEEKVDEFRRELESKEKLMEERCMAIKSKEKSLIDGFLSLDSKGREIEERCSAIKLKEEVAMREVCRAVEWKLRQTNQRFDVMEMEEERGRKLSLSGNSRGKQRNGGNEGLRLKEEELGECGAMMKVQSEKNELCSGDCSQEREMGEKKINASGEDLELMETKVSDDIEQHGLVEKQILESSSQLGFQERKLGGEPLEVKVELIDDLNVGVELETKQIRDCGKVAEKCIGEVTTQEVKDLKQTEVNDKLMSNGGVQLETKQINDNTHMAEECIGDVTEESRELKETRVNDKPMSDRDVQLETKKIDGDGNVAEEYVVDVTQGSREFKETRVKLIDYPDQLELKQKPLEHCDDMPLNGKSLQTYLNVRADKHDTMEEQIKSMLRSYKNPAKLVLGAVDGFFVPHYNQNNVVFELSVVRSSCLLLLEQLMDIKPLISEPLQQEAKTVAFKWNTYMKVEEMSDDIFVLGFLLLVGVYNLVSFFPRQELETLCGLVDQHKLAPQLRQILWLPTRHNVAWSLSQPKRELSNSDAHDLVISTVDSSPVEYCIDINKLCNNMDAPGVRSYMVQYVKEHNILHDKILDALKFASDPAKLVLDVTQSFFETKLDGVDNDAIKCSCIQLLKKLIQLSPSITPDVELEARNFAAAWRKVLIGPTNSPINQFWFLHFIAAFKLAKCYKEKQLLSLFKASYFAAKLYPPEKNVDLCSALGLQYRIPGLIKSLINKQKQLEAVKFISIFKMESEFPPVPLLEAYLELVKQRLDVKLKSEIPKGKVHAATVELGSLRSALNNIVSLELQFMFPTDSLSTRIKELEETIKAEMMLAISSRKRDASPIVINSAEQQQKRPRIESVVYSCPQFWSHSFAKDTCTVPVADKPWEPADVPGANSGAAHSDSAIPSKSCDGKEQLCELMNRG